MKWKKTEVIALCLLGIVAIVSALALGKIVMEYIIGESSYKELEQYVFLPEEEDISTPAEKKESDVHAPQKQQGEGEADASKESGVQETIVYYGQSPQVDFTSLQEKNSDIVGWIYGPGTVINYPVVQGTDNEFYLTHMFDGQENKCGSIFMDSLNKEDFSNANTILHGHHMKNGSMFASLTKYASQSYYDSHPVLWLATPEKSYQIEIFSGFVTSTDSNVWQLEFAAKEDYQSWLKEMADSSAFACDIKPDTDDKILTLATCSYEYDNARFVVMGIIRE